MRSKENMPLKLRYAPNAFLVLVCIFLSIYLFHDYMIQSPWLFLPFAGLVTGAAFGLLYLIHRAIRKTSEKKQGEEQKNGHPRTQRRKIPTEISS